MFCEIIFIRSHVLVLVFTSCVGGGGGGGGGDMFCGGTLVVDVKVICYSRVRERTSHSGPSSYCWPRRGCLGGCIRYRGETCSRETILLAGKSS